MTKIIIAFFISLLLGFAGGVSGTFWVLHHESQTAQPLVRARSFELIDETGKTVSTWGIDQYHNPLLAFSPRGTTPPGASGNALSLDDRDTQRVALGLSGDGDPLLLFQGNDKKPRAKLWVSEYGQPVFSLYDESSWRVVLGVLRSDTPGPNDRDWGLDFYPDRAAIGMGTTQEEGKNYVHGYFSVHRDKVPFP